MPAFAESHWHKSQTGFVDVKNIHVVDRIIPPTKARIDAMARSLSGPLGQLVPILIAKHLYSSWRVVTGATRLAAATQLGWKQIEATIIGADNSFEYQLIEIAENLHRHDLSEGERSVLEQKQADLSAERLAYFKALMKKAADDPAPPPPPRPHRETGNPPGRPKGGVRDAARKAGVPKSTADRHVKKASGAILPRSEPMGQNPPPPTMVRCPTCGGTGRVPL